MDKTERRDFGKRKQMQSRERKDPQKLCTVETTSKSQHSDV